jgi:hypothetical protein
MPIVRKVGNVAILLVTVGLILAPPALAQQSEALRRAMLAYLNDTSNPVNAYPAYWAPFSIVGEGVAR